MKKLKYCLPVMLLWLVLAAALWLAPKKEISTAERRKLQQLPQVSTEAVLSGRFMSRFESFTQDQFPLRDTFRRLKAAFSYGLARRLDNNGIYIVRGSAAQLEYPLSRSSAEKAAAKFQSIYDRYLKGGSGKIVFAVVPDKGYYLAAPNGYPAMDYEAMFDTFRALPWAQYADLTAALTAASYYRTDTHWRQECLTDAAALLADALGVDIDDSYTPEKLERPFYGVYYGQAALPLEPDALWLLKSDTLRACSTYNMETGETAHVYDETRLDSRDLYDVFLSGAVSVLEVENTAADTERELVIFRDSFASSLAPLLLPGYARITLIDLRYVPADRLGEYVDFENQDILFLYSTLVLNQSSMLR